MARVASRSWIPDQPPHGGPLADDEPLPSQTDAFTNRTGDLRDMRCRSDPLAVMQMEMSVIVHAQPIAFRAAAKR